MRQIDSDPSADSSQNSFHHSSLPSILAFPKNGNSWRVDWFGDVAFPNRSPRRSQQSVCPAGSNVLTAARSAPRFLREIVEELKELDGIRVELLTKSEQDGWGIAGLV
jgi:hypothetical protein